MKKYYVIKIEETYKNRFGEMNSRVTYEGRCTKRGAYISVDPSDKEDLEKYAFKSVKAAMNYMNKREYKSFETNVRKVMFSIVEM